MTKEQAEQAVHQASEHLYMALNGIKGPQDFDAHSPIVMAIAAFGTANREGRPQEEVDAAAEHVYMALRGWHQPMDFDAHQPVVKALAEFGEACRHAGEVARRGQ